MATDRHSRPSRPYVRLFWRLFIANAVVLLGVSLAASILFTPGGLRPVLNLGELALFSAALLLMIALNLFVSRRMFAPLDEVLDGLRTLDIQRPGARLPAQGRPSEAAELTEAFNAVLARLQDERGNSARRTLQGQEAERLRVARELHDEVGQNLTAALLQLSRLRKQAPESMQGELGEVSETVRENLEELRRIAQRLRPQQLDELGLRSALGELGERLGEQGDLAVERGFDELPPLSPEQELVIYRVAQEALTNVLRHAEAQHATLSLRANGEAVILRVADDGAGMDGSPPGAGIQGMHERAAIVGADLTLDARPDGGTELRLVIPTAS